MSNSRMILTAAAVFLAAVGARAQPGPAANDMAPQAVTATKLMASAVPSSDLDRSIAFYTKGLGMTSGGRMEMAKVTKAPLIFPGGGAYLMLQKPKEQGAPLPARGALGRVILAVPDLKALDAQLTAAGYHLKGGIHEEPQYHVAVGMIDDPDGNVIELVQRTQ